MTRAFSRWTAWIVDCPQAAIGVVLLISVVAVIGYWNPDLVSDLLKKLETTTERSTADSTDDYEAPPAVETVNLANAHSILVVESESFFTPRGAKAMRHVVDSLESLDHVESILWMDRVPILNIFGLPEPLFPRSEASENRFSAAKEKALRHPLVGGQLLSNDGKTLLLMVNFDFLFVESDDDCMEGLRKSAEKAAAEFPDVDLDFYVTGWLPTYVTVQRFQEDNRLKYQIIGYSMVLLMSIILFRGIIAVMIVAIAPALGVFWTLGILRFFEVGDNPFNDVILPVLLSLVGLTDGVHMMVEIRRLRASGLSPQESARAGISRVGLACALTSLTTAIGFGSLGLAEHKIVREFGFCCVVGVTLTFVAVIICIPLLSASVLGRRVHIGHEKSLIDKNLNRISGLIDFVLSRTKKVSVAAIVCTTILIAISLTLRPDERMANLLPTRSEAAIAMRKMDKAFGGLEQSNVDINWQKTVPADSAEILEVLRKVDDLLRKEELIGNPLSIRNFLDALPGDGNAEDRMSMLELLPPPLKRAFYTPEYRRASVSFRVQDVGIAAYSPVFYRIEEGIEKIRMEHPKFTLDLSGPAVGRWENLYQIVVDLAKSLGAAAFIILVVLSVVYRSIRIGLISVVPNTFPLAVAAAFLVFSGQPLEIVSVCAFTVCLGIAVDDTIHFLTRYQEERRQTADDHDAIRRAFTGVGTALIMTTVVLVAGFTTVLFSDSHDHRTFAGMGGITIASALFADLFFLPALLAQFAYKEDETPFVASSDVASSG